MNQNILKEKYFLHFLVNADKKQTKWILKIMNKSQMEAICAIVYNAIHGTFLLKQPIIDSVRPYKQQLYQIIDKKIAAVKRKELMIRRVQEIVIFLRSAVKDIPMKNVS